MKSAIRKSIAVLAAALCSSAIAAVSPEEAKLLDSPTYTPWGAERAGNKEGTIPAWTGELIKPPADYDPKEPTRRPDPWKDKPLFTITAQNMAKYADKLTDGQKLIFKRYPDYRMDIYQSHRNAHYPKWVLDMTKKNATSCKTTDNELKLSGCWGGIVFPFPKNGAEVVWNHVTRYESRALHCKNQSFVVNNDASRVLSGGAECDIFFPFHDPARTAPAQPDDIYYKLRWHEWTPPRKVGEVYLMLFSLANVARVWSYVPGQRRVKLAPDLAYDTPTPGNGGVVTIDQAQLFFGAMDRFDFKLVGKREMYIMYNTYNTIADWKVCPTETLLKTAHFINPDCVRWELHRVWQVDATLKPNFRHITPHRVMYFDEDQFGGGTSEDYDAGGKLYKVGNSFPIQLYNGPEGSNYNECTNEMDLLTGLYSPVCIHGAEGLGIAETEPKSDFFFSPESMAAAGIR